jgi:hypothetical protein
MNIIFYKIAPHPCTPAPSQHKLRNCHHGEVYGEAISYMIALWLNTLNKQCNY